MRHAQTGCTALDQTLVCVILNFITIQPDMSDCRACRELGHPRTQAWAGGRMASISRYQQRDAEGITQCGQSLRVFDRDAPDHLPIWALRGCRLGLIKGVAALHALSSRSTCCASVILRVGSRP